MVDIALPLRLRSEQIVRHDRPRRCVLNRLLFLKHEVRLVATYTGIDACLGAANSRHR